jgi:hypothetical protein
MVNYPCLLTRFRPFLEAGASWFNDVVRLTESDSPSDSANLRNALCRNNYSSRRERSLHRRVFGVTHPYVGESDYAVLLDTVVSI